MFPSPPPLLRPKSFVKRILSLSSEPRKTNGVGVFFFSRYVYFIIYLFIFLSFAVVVCTRRTADRVVGGFVVLHRNHQRKIDRLVSRSFCKYRREAVAASVLRTLIFQLIIIYRYSTPPPRPLEIAPAVRGRKPWPIRGHHLVVRLVLLTTRDRGKRRHNYKHPNGACTYFVFIGIKSFSPFPFFFFFLSTCNVRA